MKKEMIPLHIGRLSSGELYTVDLAELPHLFISYSRGDQLQEMFSAMIGQLNERKPRIVLALSLGSRLAADLQTILPAKELSLQFTHSSEEDALIRVIDEFIQTIHADLKTRMRLSRLKGPAPVLAPIVVMVDDIFEVLRSPQRKTIKAFIELLVKGPGRGIHFIMAASGIYRNLLNHLLRVDLAKDNKGSPGAELVINPDGLVFYRDNISSDYKRIFPINSREGLDQ